METLTDPPIDTNQVKKGGFWIRFMAAVIDSVILNTINGILIVIGIIALGLGPSGIEELLRGGIERMSLLLPYYLCSGVITVVYYTFFHGSTGQTPGKMICRLKVVQLNGEQLGYGKAFLRWAGYLVSGFALYLGYLWAAWDSNKQAWHDKIAGTYVVRISSQN